MASKRGTAILIEDAQARVDTVLPRLGERLGIDVPPVPTNPRDPLLEQSQRVQWLADTLEAIDHAVAPLADALALKGEVDRLTQEIADLNPGNTSPEGGEGTPGGEIPEGATVLDAQYDQEQYRDLKLDQLKAIARLAGASDDDVGKLRTKAEVLEVITARAAAEDFVPVMFTIGDEGDVEAFEPPADLESGAGETGPDPSTSNEDQ